MIPPIFTEFDTVTHLTVATLSTIKISNFYPSKMATAAILKTGKSPSRQRVLLAASAHGASWRVRSNHSCVAAKGGLSKTAELIERPFRGLTDVRSRKWVLLSWAHWRHLV